MATGLLALLDDVAALVKVSAASLDDIPAQVAKTSGKVSGIIIDDAAVTPKYVLGLDPSREISIIYHIAKKSLINKLMILGPAALTLGYFAPWIITPILMIGGSYLCFEGYEKVHSLFSRTTIEKNDVVEEITPLELERLRIDSAVRTDLVLSAEIVAITYANVADKALLTQVVVMLCVAVLITVAVYGFVGLIVKADDFGVHLATGDYHAGIKKFGRGLVKFMPHFLIGLSYVGTAAMLWVGAEIIAHGIPFLHHGLESLKQSFGNMNAIAWMVNALVCAIGGLLLGAIVHKLLLLVRGLIK